LRGYGNAREAGQVLIVALVVLSLTCTAIGVTYTVAQTTIARIELQNAVDAGATAGAAMVADGLNLLAITNSLLLTLGFGGFFSGGATLKYVRSVQRLQDAIISTTPKSAAAIAISTAMNQGADLASPIPGRGVGRPSLMVKRAYFLQGLLGKSFPLWVEDKFRATPSARFGDRVVMIAGVRRVKTLTGGTVLLSAKAYGAVSGSRVLGETVFWPWPEPGYFPRLMADER
jgi:hypothetical protein